MDPTPRPVTGVPINPPRRLLHVFSTFKVGGPQVRFANIVNQLGNSWCHEVIAMDDRFDCANRIASSVQLKLHEGVGGEVTRANVAQRIFRMSRYLDAIRPDLLATYNWGSVEWVVANCMTQLPHIHVEDGFGPEESHGQLRRRVLLRRLLLGRADYVVVPSRTLRHIALERWHIDPLRLGHIPNGISPERYEATGGAGMDVPFPGPAGRLVVGTVGALRTEKNIGRLIDAVALIPSHDRPFVVIAGDGPDREPLMVRAQRCGLDKTLVFLGHVEAPETVLRHFDIFAISSDTEQMPYSVLEAMAAGLPVASVDVGDVATMVCAENRPFVKGDDDQSLRDSIIGLFRSPGLRCRIGEENRRKVAREYSLDGMVTRYSSIFDDVASSHQSTRILAGRVLA